MEWHSNLFTHRDTMMKLQTMRQQKCKKLIRNRYSKINQGVAVSTRTDATPIRNWWDTRVINIMMGYLHSDKQKLIMKKFKEHEKLENLMFGFRIKI